MTDLEIQKLAEEIIITKEAFIQPLLKGLKLVGRVLSRKPAADTARRAAQTGAAPLENKGGDWLTQQTRNWSSSETVTPLTKAQKIQAPKEKSFFGLGKERAPESAVTTSAPAKFKPSEGMLSWVDPRVGYGEAVGNIDRLRRSIDSKGLLKGIGEYSMNQLRNSQHFTRNGLKYKRSPLGRVMNPIWSSGAGMGALGAATAEGTNGAPATMGQRLTSGAGQAALWGVAPHAAGMYYLGRGVLDAFKK